MIDRYMLDLSIAFAIGGSAVAIFGLSFLEVLVTAIVVVVLDSVIRSALTRLSATGGETDR